MAKVFLDPGDTFTIKNNNVSVFGTTGDETVIVDSSASGLVLDSNIETVQFSGNLSTFQFAQLGNSVRVYDTTGSTLLATIPVQQDGTNLTFSDQTVSAVLNLTDFIMEIGGTDIGTSPGPVTPQPSQNSAPQVAEDSTNLEIMGQKTMGDDSQIL